MVAELTDLRLIVYDKIKQAILNRDLQSGMKLTVEDLTKMFGVSPTPVKEALIALEKEGLVENIPRRGAFVSVLTLKDVEELYSIRESLEGLCARRLTEKIDDTSIVELSNIISDSERYAKANDFLKYEEADKNFHKMMRELTGDKRLIYFLSILEGQLRLVLPVVNTLPGRLESSLQEHKKILQNLEKRNVQNVEFYCREHVRLEKEAVLADLKLRGLK
ncbi:MAG: GntR family transcriptional regulator [bacterium]|nr:GntR family transcriptional regulator [bacterium]